MIPCELKLKNFMSYGNNVPPISFSSFNLACLTGENGNGKSALLDAITWAIWGQARGVDKSGAGMDDLVRLGQEEMEVSLTFKLEKELFRVIRKRDKRRGLSILELQIKDGEGFRTISGDKIAETQKKIIQVLKMDYETFINSAFVLQGKADTFTQQKPNDRKRILGEILGLSFYDNLEKKAREKVRLFEQKANGLEQQINLLKDETKEKDNFKLQLNQVSQKVSYLNEVLKAKEIEHQSLLEAKQDYDEALSQANQLRIRIDEEKGEIVKLEEIIKVTHSKILQGEQILQKEEEVLEGFSRYQAKAKLKDEFEVRQSKHFEFLEIQNNLENVIKDKKRNLEFTIANLRNELQQLAKALQDKDRKVSRYNHIKERLEGLEKLKQSKKLKEEEAKNLETELGVKRYKIPEIQDKLQQLKENYLTLKKAPKCPYCSTDLTSEDSKNQVLQLLAKEGKEASSNLQAFEARSKELEQRLMTLTSQLRGLDTEIIEMEKLSIEYSLLERDLQLIRESQIEFKGRKDQESKLLETLKEENFIAVEKQQVKEVQEQIKALNFNKEVYVQITREVTELKFYHEKMSQLQMAKETIKEQESSLAYYLTSKDRKLTTIENDEGLFKLLHKRADELKHVPGKIEVLLKELAEIKMEHTALQQRKGALQERFERCLNLEKERKQKEEEWYQAKSEKTYYTELSQAFGKKGIQAIIIENSIPELQDEANRLLNKMTDGRLNVALITQKGTKSGSVVETLDIQISDELGTRKYEMYSGGEAFRVNFALRIALSKLLAKRAGARLQTLVIDEGFGTQDGKGRERLIELINAIQEDFSKIIVITHIQELKDAFPVHLEVKKGQEGSIVSIT